MGTAEVFRDEDVAFASTIWASGGDCELHVWEFGDDGRVIRFRHFVDTGRHAWANGVR